jgi:molybdopterin-synthase adenylyltransferase
LEVAVKEDAKHARQSFLGADSQEIFKSTRVGLIGLGGGGSHIVQQLAHIGFMNYVLFDPDIVKGVNLNRLVGATREDAKQGRFKTEVAERTIRGLEPDAIIQAFNTRWQENADALKTCRLLFACVDGYSERAQIEAVARRYLIPVIDIGLDVHKIEGQGLTMSGQVVLSMPGHACMKCMTFLTEDKLGKEAALYGAAGGRPQVVWPNGVLASTAVGIAVDLLTDWTRSLRGPVYLTYDGKRSRLVPHPFMDLAPLACPHYPLDAVGDPVFRKL